MRTPFSISLVACVGALLSSTNASSISTLCPLTSKTCSAASAFMFFKNAYGMPGLQASGRRANNAFAVPVKDFDCSLIETSSKRFRAGLFWYACSSDSMHLKDHALLRISGS